MCQHSFTRRPTLLIERRELTLSLRVYVSRRAGAQTQFARAFEAEPLRSAPHYRVEPLHQLEPGLQAAADTPAPAVCSNDGSGRAKDYVGAVDRVWYVAHFEEECDG